MNFVILFVPALIVLIVSKYMYGNKITPKEIMIHFGIILVASCIALGATYAVLYSKLSDVEILNGEVTGKYRHKEICTESSSCKHYTWHERCTRNSKGERSCTSYKVFDYVYEVDWYVQSTVGEFEIERVNRQGTIEPNRYTIAKKGDPASAEHRYVNYLFADEHSLFASKTFSEQYDEDYQKGIPNYPNVYDYYNVSHVVNKSKASDAGYEKYLRDKLRTMGEEKQVNIVVVMYDYRDVKFVDATISKWRGGKKNDVIMFFGVDDSGNVKAFDSTSFAQGMNNEALHSKMRMDAINEKLSLDLVKIQVDNINTLFNRLPNQEFEYMKYTIEPAKWVIILISIVLLIISIYVGQYMRDNDL